MHLHQVISEAVSNIAAMDRKRRQLAQQLLPLCSQDLLKLNKLIPMDSQVPSMIVELQATANDAGLKFLKIVPVTPIAGTDGGTIVPIEINVQGEYFDVHDFLYRVENYARMEGNKATGFKRRILIITNMP